MFFRREKTRRLTFDEQLDNLRKFGFEVQQREAGTAKVTRRGCAGHVKEAAGAAGPVVENTGLMVGDEVADLVDAGFQKFWLAPSGRKLPALANQLKALHAFQEDLKEALGDISLYNESLGTVNDKHLYDRVLGRDAGAKARPWEAPVQLTR